MQTTLAPAKMPDAPTWQLTTDRRILAAAGRAILTFQGPQLNVLDVMRAEQDQLAAKFRDSKEVANTNKQAKRLAEAERNVATATRELELAEKQFRDGGEDEMQEGMAENDFELRRGELAELTRRRDILREEAATARRGAEGAWGTLVAAATVRINADATADYDAAIAELNAVASPLLERLRLAAMRKAPYFARVADVLGDTPARKTDAQDCA